MYGTMPVLWLRLFSCRWSLGGLPSSLPLLSGNTKAVQWRSRSVIAVSVGVMLTVLCSVVGGGGEMIPLGVPSSLPL